MRKEDNRSKLEILQEVRDEAKGHDEQHLKAQQNIDNYFFKNPPKNRKKQKKRHVKNPDDLWW